MKKSIVCSILTLFLSTPVLACTEPNETTYSALALAILYKDTSTMTNITNNYCVSYLKTSDLPDSVLMISNDFNQFKALWYKALKQNYPHVTVNDLNENIATGYNENLLVSRMLLPYRTEQMKQTLKNDINYLNNDLFKGKYRGEYILFDEKENKKIITFLSKQYDESYTSFVDGMGNTPTSYAILTNNPVVLKDRFSHIDGASILYRSNRNRVTPLHLLFSPEVKNKDMTDINDLIMQNLEFYKMRGVMYHGINYLQFVTIMKENNMDLYKKLMAKFKYKDAITPQMVSIVQSMPLTYIDKANQVYERTRN